MKNAKSHGMRAALGRSRHGYHGYRHSAKLDGGTNQETQLLLHCVQISCRFMCQICILSGYRILIHVIWTGLSINLITVAWNLFTRYLWDYASNSSL